MLIIAEEATHHTKAPTLNQSQHSLFNQYSKIYHQEKIFYYESFPIKLVEATIYQMHKYRFRDTKSMKKQGNMMLPEEHINSLGTDPREKEIDQFPEKEFQLLTLRKLMR